MVNPLSILVTKEPASSEINLFRVNQKTAKSILDTQDKGCSAFVETIADLDNAHFITKYEMQDLTTRLSGLQFNFPPRDRLVAAKALANALVEKQESFPEAKVLVKEANTVPTRCCAPQSQITPCKAGTKLAMLVGLLQKGSTMEEMRQATGWAEGGVLSGLNYDLNKRKGLGYRITGKGADEVYTLVLPSGFIGEVVV